LSFQRSDFVLSELAVRRTYLVSLGNTLISGPIHQLNSGYERAPLQSRSARFILFAFFITKRANAPTSKVLSRFYRQKSVRRMQRRSRTVAFSAVGISNEGRQIKL
jgi:hypothetical protein